MSRKETLPCSVHVVDLGRRRITLARLSPREQDGDAAEYRFAQHALAETATQTMKGLRDLFSSTNTEKLADIDESFCKAMEHEVLALLKYPNQSENDSKQVTMLVKVPNKRVLAVYDPRDPDHVADLLSRTPRTRIIYVAPNSGATKLHATTGGNRSKRRRTSSPTSNSAAAATASASDIDKDTAVYDATTLEESDGGTPGGATQATNPAAGKGKARRVVKREIEFLAPAIINSKTGTVSTLTGNNDRICTTSVQISFREGVLEELCKCAFNAISPLLNTTDKDHPLYFNPLKGSINPKGVALYVGGRRLQLARLINDVKKDPLRLTVGIEPRTDFVSGSEDEGNTPSMRCSGVTAR